MWYWTVTLNDKTVVMVIADTVRGSGDSICPDVKLVALERQRYGWRQRTVTADEAESVKKRPEYATAVAVADRLAVERESERRLRDEAIMRSVREMAELRLQAELHGKPGYFRFGRVPRTGRSWNYRDNEPEPGVSCYRGWLMPDGRVILDWSETDIVSARFVRAGRVLYRVYGEVVGTGADGEPCLKVRRAVRLPEDTVILAVR